MLCETEMSSAIHHPDETSLKNKNVVNFTKGSIKGQRNEDFDVVSFAHFPGLVFATKYELRRGLDNAGKTTIVKKIMNEDVNSVSPTLGFIIKTIDYDGYALFPQPMGF